MYGVVIHFDVETEAYMKQLWVELSVGGISKYAEEVSERRPHITLASYNELHSKELIDTFEAVYRNIPKFEMKLSTLGMFVNTGTLFIAPTPTQELITFHNVHHHKFIMYEESSNPLYKPNNWIPHCTIANRLTQEKLLEAIHYCNTRIQELTVIIDEVSIIKPEYMNNKCVSAPVIVSRRLV
ncbi:2'-5' RNA ligase family protein [Paenibacillus sp. Marseille-Q4541]|uniref:2'-5' RNA ligase family protein n=1 Tax=Paenibacillus sp. Marseille-Q4541 TaxID=2831522 RepID=UPI001BAAD8DF|nr:2'-5' RNA ligase family protein [Paenibacillus sp. Marseille-Q4541]